MAGVLWLSSRGYVLQGGEIDACAACERRVVLLQWQYKREKVRDGWIVAALTVMVAMTVEMKTGKQMGRTNVEDATSSDWNKIWGYAGKTPGAFWHITPSRLTRLAVSCSAQHQNRQRHD
jgi:hypothetical protein